MIGVADNLCRVGTITAGKCGGGGYLEQEVSHVRKRNISCTIKTQQKFDRNYKRTISTKFQM